MRWSTLCALWVYDNVLAQQQGGEMQTAAAGLQNGTSTLIMRCTKQNINIAAESLIMFYVARWG
jgi:hypothetical protein